MKATTAVWNEYRTQSVTCQGIIGVRPVPLVEDLIDIPTIVCTRLRKLGCKLSIARYPHHSSFKDAATIMSLEEGKIFRSSLQFSLQACPPLLSFGV